MLFKILCGAREYQRRVLLYGCSGIILRTVMIIAAPGSSAASLDPVPFGAFLVVTGSRSLIFRQ